MVLLWVHLTINYGWNNEWVEGMQCNESNVNGENRNGDSTVNGFLRVRMAFLDLQMSSKAGNHTLRTLIELLRSENELFKGPNSP